MKNDDVFISVSNLTRSFSEGSYIQVLESIQARYGISDLDNLPERTAQLLFDELDFIENDLR